MFFSRSGTSPMIRRMNEVRVRVPATTANLGPGFDCLGIALKLFNTTTVRRGCGPACGDMASEAAALFFHETRQRPFAFHWSVEGDVPRSRGLGSSVTVRLGVLSGLNELAGRPLRRADLFRLCAGLEGHPDNAAPAAYGGFTITPPKGPLQRYRIDSRLHFALLIPDFEISTPAARRALPSSLPLGDASFSVGSAAAVAAAFATGNYKALQGSFQDRLHQPFREPLIPCLPDVIAAATDAGALGGWLSGSGSTIACATLRNPQRVARAMLAASRLADADIVVAQADNTGIRTLA